MTALRIPVHTNNTALPVYAPNAADLAINRIPSLTARIKGRAGHLTDANTKQHDYAVSEIGKAYTAAGSISSTPVPSLNGKGCLNFPNGGGAFVDLTDAAVPINSDYTVVWVMNGVPATGARAILGNAHATLGVIYIDGGKPRLLSNNSANTGVVLSNPTGPNIVAMRFTTATRALDVRVNGVAHETGTVGQLFGPLKFVGKVTNLAVPLVGQIAEIMTFSSRLSDVTLATIEAHLKTEYGL